MLDMDPVIPQPPARIPWAVLDRYLSGEATRAELELVERALAAGGAMLPDVALRDPAAYTVSAEPEHATQHADAWAKMEERLAQSAVPQSSRAPGRSRGTVSRVGMYATALAVAVFASVAVVRVRNATIGTSDTPSRIYTTNAGQFATVTLPDGSRAVLGPATSLRVTVANATTTATVAGQVLFTVAHNASTPFVVRTNQSVTRVLGTTFFVRQYATDRTARIVVNDGRVAVQAQRSGVESQSSREHDQIRAKAVLVANTMGVINDSGQVIVVQNVVARDYTAWTTGNLVFNETPVPDIIADLARAYGADIRVTDSLLTRQTLTWKVQTTQYPLAQALHELSALLQAHVVRKGNVITLVRGRITSQRLRPSLPTFTSESQYGR